jgi:hypothetical protein
MGQKGGPFSEKGKKRGSLENPFKSFAFLREGQKAGVLGEPLQKLCLSQRRAKSGDSGGDGMMEVVVPVSYTINVLDIQFPPHQNNIILTFTILIVAMRSRLIPASSGGVIHG